jgi:hypothetical protein
MNLKSAIYIVLINKVNIMEGNSSNFRRNNLNHIIPVIMSTSVPHLLATHCQHIGSFRSALGHAKSVPKKLLNMELSRAK